MPKGQKTLPVSAKTLPVASVNVASTTPASPLVSGSTPRQVSAPSLVTPVKVSRASLLVRAASFGRMRRPAPVAEASTVPAILDRLQSSGGGGSSSKERLKGVQQLSTQLEALRVHTDAAMAREGYAACEQRKLCIWLLQPLAETAEAAERESPLLQASCSVLCQLAQLGGARGLIDASCAALLVRAIAAPKASGNQRAALACVAKLCEEPSCVHLLRTAQVTRTVPAILQAPCLPASLQLPPSASSLFYAAPLLPTPAPATLPRTHPRTLDASATSPPRPPRSLAAAVLASAGAHPQAARPVARRRATRARAPRAGAVPRGARLDVAGLPRPAQG